jgi:hypothetical protein
MDEAAPGMVSSRPPWLRPIVRIRAYDTLTLIGVMLLAVIAWIGLGHGVLGLMLVCVGTCVAAGRVAAAGVRMRCWTCVLPSTRYLLLIGLVACLLLRPTDGLLRAGLTGGVAGLLALWVGRSSPVRVHPAVLAVLLSWPLAWAWPVMEPDVHDQREIVRVPAWPTAIEKGEPRLRPEHAGPLHRFVLAEFESIAAEPERLRRMAVDGTLPSLNPVLWNAMPSCLGMVSVPGVLLAGAWLLRWRVLHWRVPLYGLFAAGATVALWPDAGEAWTTLEAFAPLGMGAFLTWVSYVLLATPLPVVVTVVSGYAMPISLPGRAIFAAIIGVVGTIGMVVTQAPEGLLIGVVAAGLLSRPLDRVRSSPFVRGRLVD